MKSGKCPVDRAGGQARPMSGRITLFPRNDGGEQPRCGPADRNGHPEPDSHAHGLQAAHLSLTITTESAWGITCCPRWRALSRRKSRIFRIISDSWAKYLLTLRKADIFVEIHFMYPCSGNVWGEGVPERSGFRERIRFCLRVGLPSDA